MKRVEGNLWKMYSDVKVIPTNGVVSKQHEAVMGAGVAKQAADMYPFLPYSLGKRIEKHGNYLYVFQLPPYYWLRGKCSTLVTFPTKGHWNDLSTLTQVERSTTELVHAANQNGWGSVLLPEVGMGLGWLPKVDVYDILNDYLDDRFTIVKYVK